MNGYKHLQQLHLERQGSFPYPVKYKHKPNSANGLTRCIKDFINYIGGFARRVNTTGQWVQPKAKEGIIQRGYYRKTTGTKGEGDISFTYNGKSFVVEVKYGADRQSEDQKDFQKRLEQAGGIYYVAKDFDEFYEWFKKYL